MVLWSFIYYGKKLWYYTENYGTFFYKQLWLYNLDCVEKTMMLWKIPMELHKNYGTIIN